mmetsp:Transcript_30659/g.81545  ORF Transcript_30659/g.81545 Transcript_30659/m.81545 type:complete len:341 (+) Transcript_30659:1016-2038(+)
MCAGYGGTGGGGRMRRLSGRDLLDRRPRLHQLPEGPAHGGRRSGGLRRMCAGHDGTGGRGRMRRLQGRDLLSRRYRLRHLRGGQVRADERHRHVRPVRDRGRHSLHVERGLCHVRPVPRGLVHGRRGKMPRLPQRRRVRGGYHARHPRDRTKLLPLRQRVHSHPQVYQGRRPCVRGRPGLGRTALRHRIHQRVLFALRSQLLPTRGIRHLRQMLGASVLRALAPSAPPRAHRPHARLLLLHGGAQEPVRTHALGQAPHRLHQLLDPPLGPRCAGREVPRAGANFLRHHRLLCAQPIRPDLRRVHQHQPHQVRHEGGRDHGQLRCRLRAQLARLRYPLVGL